MKKLMELLGKDVELKLDRDWCWVSGNTKPVKDELKNLGFQWSPRRKEWYHRDAKSLGITSDLVEVKAIEPSKTSKKSTSKAKTTSKAKAKSTSKSNANARSTYKYGAKRFIKDFANEDELAEILLLLVERMGK